MSDHNPQLTPPANFMGPAVAASKSVGLPFGFAEFGLATPKGRPAWLAEVGNYLSNSGALFGTLFDSSGHLNTYITDSASMSAWRSVVSRSGPDTPVSAPITPLHQAAPAALGVSGLALSPAKFTAVGANHTTITFMLAQRADITVCVLNSAGDVVRHLAKPGRAAGKVSIGYWGYASNGSRLAAGRYHILIVASNGQGSATAETTVTVAAP